MRKFVSLALAAGVLFGSVGLASAAGTDREVLQKKLGKYAFENGGKKKSPCICTDASNPNRVGWLYQYVLSNQVYVNCALYTYDGAGTEGSPIYGCSDFILPAK